jgi:hypothetical protein
MERSVVGMPVGLSIEGALVALSVLEFKLGLVGLVDGSVLAGSVVGSAGFVVGTAGFVVGSVRGLFKEGLVVAQALWLEGW